MKCLISVISIFLLFGCYSKGEPNLVRTSGAGILAYEKWYINPEIKNSKHLGSSTEYYGASAEKYRDNYIIKIISTFTEKEIPAEDLYKVKRSDKWWRADSSREKNMQNMIHNREQRIKTTICIDDPLYNEVVVKYKNGEIHVDSRKGYYFHTYETREEFEKRVRAEIIEDDWEDDPNQFFYEKDEKGNFIIFSHISDMHPSKKYAIIPIRQCFSDGWCLTYKPISGEDLYVKKAALIKY